MADLDPKLQAAMTEFVEHQNRRMRAARKYGPVILLVFIAGVVAMFMWHRHQVAEMDAEFHRGVDQMEREHEERVQKMRQDHDQWMKDHMPQPPTGPGGYRQP